MFTHSGCRLRLVALLLPKTHWGITRVRACVCVCVVLSELPER